MDYKRIYAQLVEKGKNRLLEGYSEKHHIIPRCMGGSDTEDNLVRLSPEEHYIAHQLLVKIYPNHIGIAQAAAMMIANRPGNKFYGWLRKRHAKAMSIRQQGKHNSHFGPKWIHHKELRENKKVPGDYVLPSGWEVGRMLNWDQRRICKGCSNEFKSKSMTSFCSKQCKTYYMAPHFRIIDENFNEMEQQFIECKSINKVLTSYGMINRKGNTYFSSLLKERGHDVLRRRNTPPD